MVNEKKVQYPLTHDECPMCGEKDGLVKEAIDELKEQGKLKKELFPDGVVVQFPLVDATRPPVLLTASTVRIPIMEIFLEACKCGNVYWSKFDMREQNIPVQMVQAPPSRK